MRSILTLAKKDVRLQLRDKLGLFFIIVFPVVMGLTFGYIGSAMSSGPKENALRLLVIDEDQTAASQRFQQYLGEDATLSVQKSTLDTARDHVRRGGASAYLVIPTGYGDAAGAPWLEGPALQLGVDPSRGAETGMLQGLIMKASGRMLQDTFTNPQQMRGQIERSIQSLENDEQMPAAQKAALRAVLSTVDSFMGALDTQLENLSAESGTTGPSMELARIEVVEVTAPASGNNLTSKLRSQWDISFPAAMMWGVMGCVAGFAISIARERAAGTFFRLQIAPITRTHILAGKALACFAFVIGVIVFMMILGLLLGIQLARPWLLLLAAPSIGIGFVGLMMFMSVLGRSEQAVAGAGWAIIVLMAMFGGGMMPLAFLPGFMARMSNFSPVKWGVYSLEGAIWRGFTATEMLVPCGILLGIGVAGFLLGARILTRTEA